MTPAARTEVADRALQQMIGQVAMSNEEARLRVVVPDAALQQTVFAMPAFLDKSGQFDRTRLDSVLRSNNLTENEFLSIVRGDLARAQVVDAIGAGAAPPAALVRAVFDFETEKRSASMIELPFAAAPEPPAPTDAELQRWYANHPDAFRVPEFRRIRAVVLSAETIANGIDVPESASQSWYDAHKAQFSTPATRTVEIAIVPDQTKAEALAAQWRGGADWATVQKAAEAAGGSASALDKATEPQIPDAALAKSAFAGNPGQVTGPVQAALGWAVLDVTAATPASERSFAQVKDEVRRQVQTEQASAMLYDRVGKIDDVLGTGTGLDKLPSDLGLVGVAGTLDAAGDTPEGQQAPIPGSPDLRKALIAAAFSHPPGPPSELTEVPGAAGSAFYAVQVEQIIPATEKPFDAVKSQVAEDWTLDARKKTQEQAAAAMLAAIKGGESLEDAAAKAGRTVRTTTMVTRDATSDAMPAQLQRVLFGLKPHEPAMVETPEAFIVAVPAKIETPDPKSDPARYDAVREVLTRSTATDLAQGFADALRARAEPRINHEVFDSFVQQ